jgi:erythronate-4-phosphate dehydrogenase
MKIIADENIAQVAAWFGHAGELVLLPGRAIDAAAVRDADALLVRSVTRVNAQLLQGSRCRFVGTATSGIDHVDTDWLKQQGIGFGWAQGSNADSVVDYVFSALAHLSERDGFDWRARSFGLVGCGQIGSRLARKLLALHIRVAIHDPFVEQDNPLGACFASYETVLQQEVVSFHTPLTRNGPWPTWHMLDAHRLAQLDPAGILINASRGAVIDNVALLQLLMKQPERRVVLDAWEGEPSINRDLLERVALGTAHIAGYSYEGKLNGTRMIAAEFHRHFDLQLPSGLHESDDGKNAVLDIGHGATPLQQLNRLVLQAYDVKRDADALRNTLDSAAPEMRFDQLRKQYPLRREFSAYSVRAASLEPISATQAGNLGFRIV